MTTPAKPLVTDILMLVMLIAFFVDAVGFYFYPGVDWFRVAGLSGSMLLFFLLGYKNDFTFSVPLLVGALLLSINGGLTGHPVFPLNLLFSSFIWMSIMAIAQRYTSIWQEVGIIWVVLITLYLPATFLMEFGSLGTMYLCLGWYARRHHTEEIRDLPMNLRIAWLFTLFFSLSVLSINNNFSMEAFTLLAVTYILTGIGLMQFKAAASLRELPAHPRSQAVTQHPSAFISRHWMYLFTAMMIGFQWIGKLTDPLRFNQGFATGF